MGQLSWAGVANLLHSWKEKKEREKKACVLDIRSQSPEQKDCLYRVSLHQKSEHPMRRS